MVTIDSTPDFVADLYSRMERNLAIVRERGAQHHG